MHVHHDQHDGDDDYDKDQAYRTNDPRT